jgi:hypothetical protein
LRGGDLQLLACLRAATAALAPFAHFEGAKSWQRNGIAFLQDFDDSFGQCRHGPAGLSFAEVGFRGYGFDKFIFVHQFFPLLQFSNSRQLTQLIGLGKESMKWEYAKHMLRLRHSNQINGAEENEIILLNSSS